MHVGAIVLTAVLSASATAVALYLLWHTRLMPDLERRAREIAEQATADASAELGAAAEALVPQFRRAVRDGIQDAILTPPTDRISQTARGVTSAGVNVVESSLRRILGGERGIAPPPPSGPPPRR
ncbi:hypothetical protein BH23ACT9_BH23ACT9_30540 [soil metagenome]